MNNFNFAEILHQLPPGTKDQFVGSGLQFARTHVDGLINHAVDHLAGFVPGGEQYTPQTKQVINSALDTLQQQLVQEALHRLEGQPG